MKCESVNRRLADYVDGRGGPIVRARIRRHLSGCGDCAEVLREDEELNVLLDTWSDDEPSPGVWLRIREALDQTPSYVPDTPVVPWWGRLRVALLRSVLPYTLGAVTTALLVVVGLDRTLSPAEPAPAPAPVRPEMDYGFGQPVNAVDDPGASLPSGEVPLRFERSADGVIVIRRPEEIFRLLEELRARREEPEPEGVEPLRPDPEKPPEEIH